MKKKQYIFPLMTVTEVVTTDIMAFTNLSNTASEEFGGVPRRQWTEVF